MRRGEGQRRPGCQSHERQAQRPRRPGAVDEAPGADGKQHGQQREQRHEQADGEFRGAQLQGEKRGRHARADEGQVAQRVQDDEIDDLQRRLQTVIATPAQATAMPASASPLGTTPNIAASSTTANTGGRYIMLATRVASPWRIR